MGYVKKSVSEKTSNSYTIGVVVAERYFREDQSFYWLLYQEISKRAIASNCFPVLEIISHDVEKALEMPRVIEEKKIDGMIVMGEFKKEYGRMLNRDVALPLLNLDASCVEEGTDCVVSDNITAGYQMTNYLFGLGHEKIGFVGTRLVTGSIDERYLGYIRSLMEHGARWRQEWVLDDRDREHGKVDAETRFILPEGDMPTAFFCNCDVSASLLIRKLEKQGYSVPEDISVVGFDNYVQDQFAGIGLTTYEIDTKEMARRAVHILLHKLEDKNYSTGRFVLAGRFIERESARRIAPPVPFV